MRINNDYFLLTIDKPLQDEVLLGNDIKLYLDPSFSVEWHATTHGTIAVKPNGATNVEVGDEVAISYSTIAERIWPDSSASFFPVTDGGAYFSKWKNGKDQWLTKVALPTPTRAIIWVVALMDNRMNLIDGCQGNESDAERYLSQFSFQDTGKYKYRNQLDIKGKIFWKSERNGIFAVRREGEIISVSDRVIVEPIMEDYTERYRIMGLLEHPNDWVGNMYLDRGRVISGGQSIGLEQGDIAGFEPKYCEKYTLWGKEYFLVKESRIDVIWQPNQN